MKIYLASDHAGFELKNYLVKRLGDDGYEAEDCGVYEYNPDDDYPDFIKLAAKKVSENPTDKAIIMGGSGQAENMVANKFKNVRSALFYSPVAPLQAADISGRMSDDKFEMVKLARIHNNANVLSLGVRFLTQEDAFTATKIFLETEFTNEERHARRIEKIKQIENE
jgi:ribose 5-phosphate isomerase B